MAWSFCSFGFCHAGVPLHICHIACSSFESLLFLNNLARVVLHLADSRHLSNDVLVTMQGLGILSAAIVSIITIRCFKDAILYHGASCLAPATHAKAHGSTACKWQCSPLTLTWLGLQDAIRCYDVQIACQTPMPGLLSAVSYNESSADAKLSDLLNWVYPLQISTTWTMSGVSSSASQLFQLSSLSICGASPPTTHISLGLWHVCISHNISQAWQRHGLLNVF